MSTKTIADGKGKAKESPSVFAGRTWAEIETWLMAQDVMFVQPATGQWTPANRRAQEQQVARVGCQATVSLLCRQAGITWPRLENAVRALADVCKAGLNSAVGEVAPAVLVQCMEAADEDLPAVLTNIIIMVTGRGRMDYTLRRMMKANPTELRLRCIPSSVLKPARRFDYGDCRTTTAYALAQLKCRECGRRTAGLGRLTSS
jgi:hypothetical protein